MGVADARGSHKPRSREAAKQATRRALLEAGLAEIAEHGFDAPSLDSICTRAGYTRGAFYVHFENRDDFILQLMDWVCASFLDGVVAADRVDVSGGVSQAIGRFVDALERDALPLRRLGLRFPQLLEVVGRLPRIRAGFATLTREAIARMSKRALDDQQAGRLRRDVDAEQLATLLVALSVGVMALCDAGLPLDLGQLGRATTRLVE